MKVRHFGQSVAAADGSFAIGAPFAEGAGFDSFGRPSGAASVFYGGAAGCGPCESSGPLGTCASAPNPTCRPPGGPGKATLKLVNGTNDARDRTTWRWKGRARRITDFGHPLDGGDVTLCVWDESSVAPTLLFRAAAPSDTSCAGSSCWHPAPGANLVSYKDVDRTPEGVKMIRLIASGPGLAHMVLTGIGLNLSGRPFGLPALPPPLPLRVQLQARDGLCWQSQHSVASPTGPPRFSSTSD